MKLYKFTVKGSGRFPLDMLRHGQCWPEDQNSVVRMTGVNLSQTEVHLIGIAPPAFGRWKSFGWDQTERAKNMRCPDCQKFVSYDEPQCEVGSVELDGDTLRANVTVQLNCQDCGGTLKDAEIEAETEIKHECKPESEQDKGWKLGDDHYEVESEGDAEGTNRLETKDRHGKPIKSSRYMKSFYGFTLESEIKCWKCGEVFSVTLEGEEQASAFNEC